MQRRTTDAITFLNFLFWFVHQKSNKVSFHIICETVILSTWALVCMHKMTAVSLCLSFKLLIRLIETLNINLKLQSPACRSVSEGDRNTNVSAVLHAKRTSQHSDNHTHLHTHPPSPLWVFVPAHWQPSGLFAKHTNVGGTERKETTLGL